MKRQYEKNIEITYGFIIFLLLFFFFVVFLLNKKIIIYEKLNGLVFDTNTLMFIVSDKELDWFYKNKVIHINNNKKKFNILKIDKKILKKDGVFYHQIYIETNISNMLKVNDVVGVSIMKKGIKSINIFKVIWDGDVN